VTVCPEFLVPTFFGPWVGPVINALTHRLMSPPRPGRTRRPLGCELPTPQYTRPGGDHGQKARKCRTVTTSHAPCMQNLVWRHERVEKIRHRAMRRRGARPCAGAVVSVPQPRWCKYRRWTVACPFTGLVTLGVSGPSSAGWMSLCSAMEDASSHPQLRHLDVLTPSGGPKTSNHTKEDEQRLPNTPCAPLIG